MKSYAVGLLLLVGFAIGLGCAGVVDQPADNVQTHIAAAKAAAGQEHKGLFDRVCTFETEQPAASQSRAVAGAMFRFQVCSRCSGGTTAGIGVIIGLPAVSSRCA